MGILASLKSYRGKWNVTKRESFAESELSTLSISSNEIVSSDFGKSVCLYLHSGEMNFIPLSTEGKQVEVGDSINLNDCEVLTLSRQGDNDIYRIEVKK